MHPALYWQRTEGEAIQCELCPRGCILRGEGARGACHTRAVQGGGLVALGYGRLASAAVDPIEKKPLYHFNPGGRIFSIGGWGCNFACPFCQNWTISQQFDDAAEAVTPDEVAAAFRKGGSIGIAYTYNEPLINMEFVRACAERVKAAGGVNVLVTNGYVRPGPAADVLPLIAALNIDVKSMDDAFYRRQCRGTLAPVLAFVLQALAAGCLVELTNLVIPGLNDSDADLQTLARWIRTEAGRGVPLHLSAYRPQYKMNAPPTPVATLSRAYDICAAELDYVYLGNVAGSVGQDTLCPGCRAVLIARDGYSTRRVGLNGGVCARCGRPADVVGA